MLAEAMEEDEDLLAAFFANMRSIGYGGATLSDDLYDRLQNLAMRHLSTGENKEKPGVFARTWPIGSTALWIAVLLTGYVLVYYF